MRGFLEGPVLHIVRFLVELGADQPAVVRDLGGFPEGFFLAGDEHVLQLQHFMVFARVVDKAAARHAVGATGVQVAGQLDNHEAVMLLAYLGLQVAAVAPLGALQKVLAIGRQRGGRGVFG